MSIILAGRNFDQGYKSDIPRDQLGTGTAYRLRDYIPDLGAPLQKRGGYSFASTDLNGLSSASYVRSLGWVPFPADEHLIAVSESGKVYNISQFDGAHGTFIGATTGLGSNHNPFWFNDLQGMVIPANGDNAVWKYYKSGGVYVTAALGGTPPHASVGAAWGDYLLLANGYISGVLTSNRIWISGVGAPETWSVGTAFEDMPAEVVRIVPMWNTILVFGYADVWLITGDTPPPGGNWTQKTVFAGTGTMDGRSIVTYQGYAIWANNEGIFKSDGYTLTDLTARGGIQQRWAELVKNFNLSQGWSAAAGIFNGHYIITVYDNLGNFVTCQVCNIDRQVWFEFTNIPALNFAHRGSAPGTSLYAGVEESFFAHKTLPRAGSISSLWTPVSGNANDADGTAVLPQIELPFAKPGGTGMKQFRRAYFTYDIRTAGASPYLQADFCLSPEENAPYTAMAGTLPTTTRVMREPLEVRQRNVGVGLRLTQVGASAATRLAEVEFDVNPLELMR